MDKSFPDNAITVYELNQRLSDAVATAPGVRNVWVVGETSDLRTSSGHCYLELIEKNSDGTNKSRIRANIWANTFRQLNSQFYAVTGAPLASGIKVRACVSASYHPSYGMSVTINDIDPSYTLGDAVRKRAEILERLTKEGILERNRHIRWAVAPNRIAVISAAGAAGYGDFITHLFSNPGRLRFSVQLFPAIMQGEKTVPTVLQALSAVGKRSSEFDAVVIIRGGGSTSDLSAFDDYSLAAAIANFPLPVIIGIGHERDTTVLDYVANLRVKTPTAAAESLIERLNRLLDALGRAAERIYQHVTERIAADREMLAHAAASVPGLARQNLLKRKADLERVAINMSSAVSSALITRREQTNRFESDLVAATKRATERSHEKLERIAALLNVLSPQAVLARGFSLTLLPDGKVLRTPADAPEGTLLTTRLSSGSLTSQVKLTDKTKIK